METNNLKNTFNYLIQCTEQLQLSAKLFSCYKKCYEKLFLYCSENNLDTFSYQNAADYCKAKCPSLAKYTAMVTTKIAYTAALYFEEGHFIWKPVTFTQYPVCAAYESLMKHFRQEMMKALSPGTVRGGMVIVRQFLYFLEQSGLTDAAGLTTALVMDFIRRESHNHEGSMPKLLRTIRKFICFLRSEGIVDLNADRFLNNAGKYRRKTLPCFTDDELRLIFQCIDQSTDRGRRDYAVFLLSLRLGLRASDISGLKLSDISWDKRNIRFIQQKTKAALELPMPVDVGNAVADYILHSRYKTDNPYVFVKLWKSPVLTPLDPTVFNVSLQEYIKKAGIRRTSRDGKTFHALRRTAGTKMVISGVPVSTVSQILGHGSVESSFCYISLDTEKLRECCLDLADLQTRKEGVA